MTKTAVITGVSRQIGIGYAIARRLHSDGWQASLSGWPAHDVEQPWGADSAAPDLPGLPWQAVDLGDPATPDRLVADHLTRFGSIDALVAVHARSSDQDLATVTAAEMDTSFAVNARATVLLVRAAARAGARRVVLFTTGVHRAPMPTEIPYAMSKAAIQGITASLAAALAGSGTTVNCVNPGPVDTGYADPDAHAFVASRMPIAPRWGEPDDIAGVVAWLLSDDAAWITGQTIDFDGGWSLLPGVPPRP
jgi:3-oxoacyl-[acyl-carrier protein] reductase